MRTLPRIDYTQVRRSEAQRIWRERQTVLRYNMAEHRAAKEDLYDMLDSLTDDELAAYLDRRRKRKYANPSGRGSLGLSEDKPLPAASIGNTHTASQGTADKYSKSHSERALQYCLRAQEQGKHVDYGQVLNDMRAGRLN
jgi:hypothetical protein